MAGHRNNSVAATKTTTRPREEVDIMKKTAEQLMESLLAMLTREARTDEDRTRLESVRQKWTTVREERERKELRILLLVEELRDEDEQFEAALDGDDA
jgi:hypothetical protein